MVTRHVRQTAWIVSIYTACYLDFACCRATHRKEWCYVCFSLVRAHSAHHNYTWSLPNSQNQNLTSNQPINRLKQATVIRCLFPPSRQTKLLLSRRTLLRHGYHDARARSLRQQHSSYTTTTIHSAALMEVGDDMIMEYHVQIKESTRWWQHRCSRIRLPTSGRRFLSRTRSLQQVPSMPFRLSLGETDTFSHYIPKRRILPAHDT